LDSIATLWLWHPEVSYEFFEVSVGSSSNVLEKKHVLALLRTPECCSPAVGNIEAVHIVVDHVVHVVHVVIHAIVHGIIHCIVHIVSDIVIVIENSSGQYFLVGESRKLVKAVGVVVINYVHHYRGVFWR